MSFGKLCIKSLLLLVFVLNCFLESHATHLRAGEITAKRKSCISRTFEITVTVYIDTKSGVQFGGQDDILDFGDGTWILVGPVATTPRPDLGEDMGMASITVTHTYSTPKTEYRITYSESNRNEQVLNMTESINTRFFLQTIVYLDPSVRCNENLPVLNIPPIDRACSGVMFQHNPGAVDRDGDSLSFELYIPLQSKDRYVNNYADPNDPKFYSNYPAANEAKDGPPTFRINSLDGTISWDAPGTIGEYNIAFTVIEWRKGPAGIFQQVSRTTRDMQIIVEDCDNKRPDLLIPKDTCVVAGTKLDAIILGTDPENHPVKIEVFSEVFEINESPATFEPDPPKFQPSSPPAEVTFHWQTSCAHVKAQYYQVVFKITDQPSEGPRLVTFKTWRIKVVAPAPEWKDASINLTNRSATVKWDQYTCSNASVMQVWRKVDGSSYEPGHCEVGMPNLGYTLVETVPLVNSQGNPVDQYVDLNEPHGLAPGARYCYRLVALFPDPKGGISYVSKDTCLVPIQADAPVITNVTVEGTSETEGSILVRWQAPFDIDRTQYPGPFEYELYRSVDNNFTTNVTRVTPSARVSDTTFVDAGINTTINQYYYRVVFYSNTATDLSTWVRVDTSAIASSVLLDALGDDGQISLRWNADVPWSNDSDRFPYHLVFRGEKGEAQHQFLLIDSASVTGSNFRYTDTGTFNNIPLDPEKTYCYRILTRGAYGNPSIKEPLLNYSQIACARPRLPEKPCTPVVYMKKLNCDSLFVANRCIVGDFSNRLDWNTSCKKTSHYRIYASANTESEFTLLADNVRDTFFIDKHLTSFARCYKVTTVDNYGNESDQSTMVCNDNCPYYELPNVFSPNEDGCNDLLRAYGSLNFLGDNSPESCVPVNENNTRCLRFVKQVSFSVFNRWGKEVYSYDSNSVDGSVYINWNGTGQDGEELASGIYYYLANIEFDVMDRSKRNSILKGWVHLKR